MRFSPSNGLESRFGVLTTLTSDHGQKAESDYWHSLMNLLGGTCLRTTAFHSQANDLVERFHKQLKTALEARLAGSNWLDDLPVVLLGILATLKEDLLSTSFSGPFSLAPCLGTRLTCYVRQQKWHNTLSARRRPVLCPNDQIPILIRVKTAFIDAAPTVCPYELKQPSCCLSPSRSP